MGGEEGGQSGNEEESSDQKKGKKRGFFFIPREPGDERVKGNLDPRGAMSKKEAEEADLSWDPPEEGKQKQQGESRNEEGSLFRLRKKKK